MPFEARVFSVGETIILDFTVHYRVFYFVETVFF